MSCAISMYYGGKMVKMIRFRPVIKARLFHEASRQGISMAELVQYCIQEATREPWYLHIDNVVVVKAAVEKWLNREKPATKVAPA